MTIPTSSRARRTLLPVATAALAGALAACSVASTPSATAPAPATAAPSSAVDAEHSAVDAEHSAVDTAFAQQMTVHHRGALAMAQLAVQRAEDPAVRDLAARVEAAQAPEIALMTGWLQAWGEPLQGSAGDAAGMKGMDHGAAEAGNDAAVLQQATGRAFDRLFLQQMTAHHEGAVEMARAEQAEGTSPQAVALAAQIEASQSAEVEEMGQLLQRLGG